MVAPTLYTVGHSNQTFEDLLGNEFGARRTDALDADNKVDFEKAVLTEDCTSSINN